VSEIDASDWYTIADDVLFDLMSRYDSRSARERPFRIAETTIDTRTFVLQRTLFDSLREPHEAGRVEESVLAIIDRVLQRAYRLTPSIAPLHRRAAQHAQTLLARDPIANTPLRTIAAEAGVSLVQLCRAFRAQTGSTMTHYRHSLRLRLALDRLHTTDLSTLAQDLGYASHSHFTAVFRRHFHATPSAFRAKP
jgi:AraC family transcriptional regulator